MAETGDDRERVNGEARAQPSFVRRVTAAAQRTPLRRWLVSFVLFGALCSVWMMTTPPGGGPDEPYHTIRAVALTRGDLVGSTRPGQLDQDRYVSVPAAYVDSAVATNCYIFLANTTPSCFNFAPDQPREKSIPIIYARYPPAYYAVAGLPSLVASPLASTYLMRLVTIAISSALIASAMLSLSRVKNRCIAAAGALFAFTPTFLSLTSTVNPNGPEIAAAIALWISGAVLAVEARQSTGGELDRRLIARVGVAATVLVLSRAPSPFWLVAIVATLLVICGWQGARRVARVRLARWWGAALVACTIAQTAWYLIVKPFDLAPSQFAVPGDRVDVVRAAVGYSWTHVEQMISLVGYSVDYALNGTYLLWTAAVAALVLGALMAAQRRLVLMILAVLVVTFLVPLSIEAVKAGEAGLFWSGRYTITIGAGVPILGGLALAWSDLARSALRRLALALTCMFVVAQVLSYGQQLRRYTVGRDGPLDFFVNWDYSPPLPPWLLLFSYVALVVAWAWWSAWAGAEVDDDRLPSGEALPSLRNATGTLV